MPTKTFISGRIRRADYDTESLGAAPRRSAGYRAPSSRRLRDDVIYQVRSALRHAPRSARGAEPAALATERQELVMPAIGAAQAQEAMRQNSAFEERVELVTDELRQAGTGCFLGLSEQALRVLLHQLRGWRACAVRSVVGSRLRRPRAQSAA